MESKDENNVESLYQWIDSYPLTRQKKNICRDFSDAVPVAEILKQHFPRSVELHNYTPKNSVAQKLVNWQILNRKVLSKLNIELSNLTMNQLANSVPGVIEKTLLRIKARLDSKEIESKNEGMYFLEGLSSTVSGSVVPIKEKDSSKVVEHKIVPLDAFTDMEQSLIKKEETIQSLQTKVQHLESLLSIKDDRINDLTSQLQKNSGTSTTPTASGGPAHFFHSIF